MDDRQRERCCASKKIEQCTMGIETMGIFFKRGRLQSIVCICKFQKINIPLLLKTKKSLEHQVIEKAFKNTKCPSYYAIGSQPAFTTVIPDRHGPTKLSIEGAPRALKIFQQDFLLLHNSVFCSIIKVSLCTWKKIFNVG